MKNTMKLISDNIRNIVSNKIIEIEKEHDVEILLCVESGSRAWGFASEDSDYDIRFIYKHGMNWYLSVHSGRDVIEYPIVDEMDYSGWDLRKTFALLYKSNPVLFEWIQSPIVYKRNEEFIELFTEAANAFYSPLSSMHHYLNMTKSNFKEYLNRDEVRIKKYFYSLRPTMACMWIERFDSPPPMEFDLLRKAEVDDNEVNSEIDLLLEKKKKSELGTSPGIEVLDKFLTDKINYYEKYVKNIPPIKNKDSRLLDDMFQKSLKA